MTKAEFIKRLQEELGGTAAQAEKALDAMSTIMGAEILGGGEIPLPGMGKLKAHKVKPRTGRNPRTGEEMTIPGGLRVAFAPGKDFKEALKN